MAARVQMKKIIGAVCLLAVCVAGWLWWSLPRAPEPTASHAAPAQAQLGQCDGQPAAPPLPASLPATSPDIGAIVGALDAALNDQQKNWLGCFTLDDELLARTHHSFGRWLRTTLRLRQAPMRNALGAASADDASSLIILVYVAHLRGRTISLTDARAQLAAAVAAAGVTQ
jgi:hypothetical protein